jgi:hypothetical protein
MNERIKQLAEQCQIETYAVNGELIEIGFDAEKFAELIIEDCICVVDGAVHHRLPASSYVDLIREHFAVE